MIKGLRAKFLILSLLSLLTLLVLIVLGMSLISYHTTIREADAVLDIITSNKGGFPGMSAPDGVPELPHGMSPELPHESRYFSVLTSESYEIIYTDTSRISAINDEEARDMAREVLKKGSSRGLTDKFRYSVTEEDGNVRVTFLDCGRKLEVLKNFVLTASIISLFGFAAVSVVLIPLSGKILSPIVESYEKQKRFITDAGHELKTPLTIINANADVLSLELGENECIDDIRKQTRRLTSLTNDLVYLARMEEGYAASRYVDFPISEVVSEAAEPFRTPAEMDGKSLVLSITEGLTLCGDSKGIGQLTCILLDNAIKYSPKDSTILLQLQREGKHVHLSVRNRTASTLSEEDTERIFDRFYRTDPSRSTSGHGIGLSVARAIVSAHNGKINAELSGEDIILNVTLPI